MTDTPGAPIRAEPRSGQRSVWDFPRPPALEPEPREVVVRLGGQEIARTRAALRVLETYHPPVYYLPPDAFVRGALRPAGGGSFCEWKGTAAYWDVVGGEVVRPRAGWSYPDPTGDFRALRDHVALYAGPMDQCTVGGEPVTPQPGPFYGGWITSDLTGPFKGSPGMDGW